MIKTQHRLNALSQVLTLPFILIVILLLMQPLLGYGEKSQQIDLKTVEETVMRYAVQCYATEGAYPPNVAYLATHYGLILDTERYIYQYEIFASNVQPIIIIYENTGYGGQQ